MSDILEGFSQRRHMTMSMRIEIASSAAPRSAVWWVWRCAGGVVPYRISISKRQMRTVISGNKVTDPVFFCLMFSNRCRMDRAHISPRHGVPHAACAERTRPCNFPSSTLNHMRRGGVNASPVWTARARSFRTRRCTLSDRCSTGTGSPHAEQARRCAARGHDNANDAHIMGGGARRSSHSAVDL
jgi:hypothetical protein